MFGSTLCLMFEAADRYDAKDFGFHTDNRTSSGEAGERRKILVVDDERLVADTIAEVLNQNGFEAVAAYSGESALTMASDLQPDILLTDVLMPNMDGVQLAVALTQERPILKVILISGQTGISAIVENARSAGHTFELLPKPIHPQELLRKLQAN